LKTLKPWLGEAVYNKLAADIRLRKGDGIEFDSNILNIDENAIVMKILDDDRPIIVVVYMVQQINCIRKKGEIVEVHI
jgi:import inner membrane translocase subunit TIM44